MENYEKLMAVSGNEILKTNFNSALLILSFYSHFCTESSTF